MFGHQFPCFRSKRILSDQVFNQDQSRNILEISRRRIQQLRVSLEIGNSTSDCRHRQEAKSDTKGFGIGTMKQIAEHTIDIDASMGKLNELVHVEQTLLSYQSNQQGKN